MAKLTNEYIFYGKKNNEFFFMGKVKFLKKFIVLIIMVKFIGVK